MGAEPGPAPQKAYDAYGDLADSGESDSAIRYATRTLPVLCALDAVRAEDAAGLAWALTAAEAVRPGVTAVLVNVFATEAVHLHHLARRVEATVARLRAPERTSAGDHCGAGNTPTHNAWHPN